MEQLHIIPDRSRIGETLELAEDYHAAFEYNDFFNPAVLDDKRKVDELISFYVKQPHDRSRDTMHGAFLDITIHSEDSLIRQASERRIRQSMEIARELGVRGVVFHTAGFTASVTNGILQTGWTSTKHFSGDYCRSIRNSRYIWKICSMRRLIFWRGLQNGWSMSRVSASVLIMHMLRLPVLRENSGWRRFRLISATCTSMITTG